MERIQSRTQGRGNVIFPVVFGTGRFDNWDQIAAMCLMPWLHVKHHYTWKAYTEVLDLPDRSDNEVPEEIGKEESEKRRSPECRKEEESLESLTKDEFIFILIDFGN